MHANINDELLRVMSYKECDGKKSMNESSEITHRIALYSFSGNGCNYIVDHVNGTSFEVSDGQRVHLFRSAEEVSEFLVSKGCDQKKVEERLNAKGTTIAESRVLPAEVSVRVGYDQDAYASDFEDAFEIVIQKVLAMSTDIKYLEDALKVTSKEDAAKKLLGCTYEEWAEEFLRSLNRREWIHLLKQTLPEIYSNFGEFVKEMEERGFGLDVKTMPTGRKSTEDPNALPWSSVRWGDRYLFADIEFEEFPQKVQDKLLADAEDNFNQEVINEFIGSATTLREWKAFGNGEYGISLADGYELYNTRGYSQGDSVWVIKSKEMSEEEVDHLFWDSPIYMDLEVDGKDYYVSEHYEPGRYEWDREKFIEACKKTLSDDNVEWTPEIEEYIREEVPEQLP